MEIIVIFRNFRRQTFAWLAAWPVFIVLAWAEPAWTGALTLEDAESLAIASDPAIRKKQASRTALSEMAVAAAQLPDPLLKVGLDEQWHDVLSAVADVLASDVCHLVTFEAGDLSPVFGCVGRFP